MRFLIVSPRYHHKSEGVVVLHQMARDLRALGYATLVIWLGSNNPKFDTFFVDNNVRSSGLEYSDLILNSFDEYDPESDIVIYPEIIPGNPLQAKRVVRYFLNRECYGYKNNKINPGAHDFILAFHSEYVDRPDLILFKPTFDLSKIENIEFGKKRLNTFYVGKAAIDIETLDIQGAINIGKINQKVEYERTLMTAKYVLTYDPLTSVIRDAILFGAIPVILNHRPWSAENILRINERTPVVDLCTGQNLYFINNYYDFLVCRKIYVDNMRMQYVAYQNNLIAFTEAVKQHFSQLN
ncbi:MAG: hypothetical protein EBR89_08645 [Betaproteobacteria bacterium]|nr:hypothetical protein [Betaproteobacteria bacterium]